MSLFISVLWEVDEDGSDPDWRAAMCVLGFGGLPISNLFGLQWGDVVRRQLDNVTPNSH